MATLALSIAAKATAGALGLGKMGTALFGAAGTMLGGLIDQRLLAVLGPGTPDQVGPRLTSFDVTGSEEGAPILRAYGPEVRVDSTQLIWLGELIEERSSESVGSGKSRSTVTSFSYYTHVAVAVCEGPISEVKKIRANGQVIYDSEDSNVGADLYTDITIHKGTDTQGVDSLIESIVNPSGTGTPAPAYRGTCYVVFEKLSLDPFGRHLPTFSVDMEADPAPYTVGELVTDLVSRGELDVADVDTSALTDSCRGVMIKQPEAIASSLDTMAAAYHFRARVNQGVLIFFPIGQEHIAYIDAEDIGVQGGEKSGMSVKDVSDVKLPREVNVQYVDPSEDYTIGSQRELRVNATGPSAVSLNLPVTLTASEARAAASRVLWERWTERRIAMFSLGPRWVSLQENDLAVVDWAGTRYHIRVTEVSRGHNYQHDITGVVRSMAPGESLPPTYLSSSPPADSGEGALAPIPYTPPTVTYEIMDLPSLLGSEHQIKGLFYAQSTGTEFRGGAYKMAATADATYTQVATTSTKARIGTVDTVLADTPNPEVWDEGNTVEVTLVEGVLSNASKQDVLAGTNYAVLGEFDPDNANYGYEIIAFRNAEYLGGASYRLSGLLRARRNTHNYTNGHNAGESFVLLSQPNVKFLPLSPTDIKISRYMKFVPVGATEDDATERRIYIKGQTTIPFAPAAVHGYRINNDWDLNWAFRSRSPQVAFNGENPANPEDSNTNYMVRIFQDDTFSDAAMARTFLPGNVFNVTYTEAQQIVDFGAVQDTLYIGVWQRVAGGGGFSDPFYSEFVSSKRMYSTLTA